jgi:hypothetical protein
MTISPCTFPAGWGPELSLLAVYSRFGRFALGTKELKHRWRDGPKSIEHETHIRLVHIEVSRHGPLCSKRLFEPDALAQFDYWVFHEPLP